LIVGIMPRLNTSIDADAYMFFLTAMVPNTRILVVLRSAAGSVGIQIAMVNGAAFGFDA
jgi:hypothetical protein